MNEKNILNAIASLGEMIAQKDFEIELRDFRVKKLEEQVVDLECTIEKMKAEIMKKDSIIEDLAERIDIMTESEAPCPVWDIKPASAAEEMEGDE